MQYLRESALKIMWGRRNGGFLLYGRDAWLR